MFKIFNEEYFLDLDKIEDYIKISKDEISSGVTEGQTISIVKYETIKLMLEIVMDEPEPIDESLGAKGSDISIPFKLAFNTLLNKKIITKY
jgi:hypothetical protein